MDRSRRSASFLPTSPPRDSDDKNDTIGILTDSKHAVAIDDFFAAAITQLGTKFNQQKTLPDRLRDRLSNYLPRFSKPDLIKQQNTSFELERMGWPALNTNIPNMNWCIQYSSHFDGTFDPDALI